MNPERRNKPSHREAPIFVDAYEVNREINRRVGTTGAPLAHRVCTRAFDLLVSLSEALRGGDRAVWLDRADRALHDLRLGLRLLADLGVLERSAQLALIERLEGIGRQLGGWRKKTGVQAQPAPRP